jgi:hypothetical protein
MGTAIVVYEDYQEYSRVIPSTDENRVIPAFTALLAISMLLGAVYILKKK